MESEYPLRVSVWRDATSAGGSRRRYSRYSMAGALVAAVIVAGAAGAAIGLGGGGNAQRGGSHGRSAGMTGSGVAATTGGSQGAGSHGAGVASTGAGAANSSGSATHAGAARTRHAAHGGAGAAKSHAGATGSGTGAAESHAGATGSGAGAAGTGASAASGSASAKGGHVVEVRDPEEANSKPAPASLLHSAASTPSTAAKAVLARGAASNAQVEEELDKVESLERKAVQGATYSTVPGGDSIAGSGKIPIPADVPPVVQRVIAGANAIADFPYVYGGGHASFVSSSYDCSGSVSYALAAGGLLSAPETSGQLESWGAPGPGKWITVYANAGHTYMYVNIGGAWMLYDTAGRSGVLTSRWQPNGVDNAGYVVRHWPGL